MSVRDPGGDRLRGIASMSAAAFVFAIMDAMMKRMSAHYSPMQVSCLRCLASLVFLVPPVIARRSWSTFQLRSPALHVFRALLGVTMLGTFVYAVRRLSLAETYAVFLCAPLLMTALSVPIHRDRVPARRWFAILIGLSGVMVILRPFGNGFGSTTAMLAAGASAACYALSALTVRSLGRSSSSASMVFWFLVMVGVATGLLALRDWRVVPLDDLGWLAAIGICGALGQFWITDAFRRAPPSVVGPFEYTAILWAFAIDWIFWSAAPTARLMTGAAVVIASGVFVIWDERRLAQLAMNPSTPLP